MGNVTLLWSHGYGINYNIEMVSGWNKIGVKK